MRTPNPKIDREAPAFRVVSYWESPSKFAQAIGRTPSTVQRWLERGTIDGQYHAEIYAAARRDRKPLKPNDFLDQRAFAKDKPAAPAAEATA